MAAILIAQRVAMLPEDWSPENVPGDQPTERERAAVVEQIGKLQDRVYSLLRFDPRKGLVRLAAEWVLGAAKRWVNGPGNGGDLRDAAERFARNECSAYPERGITPEEIIAELEAWGEL